MVKAIRKKDGCLYCPDCNQRIGIRDPKPYGCLEKYVILYGKCQCIDPTNKEWSFSFDLRKHEYFEEEE